MIFCCVLVIGCDLTWLMRINRERIKRRHINSQVCSIYPTTFLVRTASVSKMNCNFRMTSTF